LKDHVKVKPRAGNNIGVNHFPKKLSPNDRTSSYAKVKKKRKPEEARSHIVWKDRRPTNKNVPHHLDL